MKQPVEGVVRVGPLVSIPVILGDFGIDTQAVLADAGLGPLTIDDPDNLVSYSARARLMGACVKKTGCQHFGLLVGMQGGGKSLGLIGYLAQNAADVETGLDIICKYFHLHATGAAVILSKGRGQAFLGYEIYQRRIEYIEQIEDGAMAMAYNILRTLCGRQWKPTEVCFSHRKPADVKPFAKYFDAPLRFDSERNGIYFDRKWLKHPVEGADPELFRLLQKQLEQAEQQAELDFPQQVLRVLYAQLMSGDTSADAVAAAFAMHSRTLHRRLKVFNTSYQQLHDECRNEIAMQLLENTDTDISDIAGILGFTDSSVFSRAFRRWSGVTPSRWRSERRLDEE